MRSDDCLRCVVQNLKKTAQIEGACCAHIHLSPKCKEPLIDAYERLSSRCGVGAGAMPQRPAWAHRPNACIRLCALLADGVPDRTPASNSHCSLDSAAIRFLSWRRLARVPHLSGFSCSAIQVNSRAMMRAYLRRNEGTKWPCSSSISSRCAANSPAVRSRKACRPMPPRRTNQVRPWVSVAS
ncbi:hypothetical protein D3C87_1521850 [compost metagenome]